MSFVETGDAAKIAGVTARTIRSWLDAGFIVSLRIGKKHWISLDSLKSYILRTSDFGM